MGEWEYSIVDSKDIEGSGLFKGTSRETIEAYLTDLDNDGWEIFHLQFTYVDLYRFCGVAKREV